MRRPLTASRWFELTANTMRFVLYNIRYATGFGPAFHLPVPGAGYLRSNTPRPEQHHRVARSGSIRPGRPDRDRHRLDPLGLVNQASRSPIRSATIRPTSASTARPRSISLMPIVRKQGNAFLAAPRVEGERFHYFETGIKRLIIELELEECAIFLVHLSLKFRHRHDQLRHLHELVKRASKPVIVAGDFNTFWGDHEIYLFMEASGLKSANRLGLPSYPSHKPRKELDFVLYSNGIEVTQFDVPDVRFSDHRPLDL